MTLEDLAWIFTPIGRVDISRAEGFLRWLSQSCVQFHIDDNPEEVFAELSGKPAFPIEVAKALGARRDECMHALGYSKCWDVYGEYVGVTDERAVALYTEDTWEAIMERAEETRSKGLQSDDHDTRAAAVLLSALAISNAKELRAYGD